MARLIFDRVLAFFDLRGLNTAETIVAIEYRKLARYLESTGLEGPEAMVALRKLLESRDAAMRAVRVDIDKRLARTRQEAHPRLRPVPDPHDEES